MRELLLAVGLMLVVLGLLTGTAVVLTVLAVRAVVAAVRPPADRARLRARAYGFGPSAGAARLRLDLHAAVAASGRTLAVARTHGWPLGDAPALHRRLSDAARGLDGQLRAAGSEPDPRRAAAAVAAIRGGVAAVVTGAGELRDGLLAAGRRLDSAELHALERDCALESRALRG